MEDTQVLDAESKAAPLQSPVAVDNSPVLNAPTESTNNNIYSAPTAVVGEKDHASDIANNFGNYDFESSVDQSKDPTVTTQSTTRNNVTDNVTWESQYTMDKQFKATDDADYTWNKLAKERSQYTYDQESTQVLSDYAKSMQEIKEAGAIAMDTYFGAAYNANQTADKMGWQGGQVTSNEAKTAFLKASTAANMYSKFELQEYGLESQLSVARMYAEANMEKLALDMYQDELNKAVRESELTGWYISPEASEIMKQQKVAKEIIANKNASEADKQRAQNIITAGYAYFDKLGFEKSYTDPETGETIEYPGVNILARREFEETKRSNLRNEELQQQNNDIAREAAENQDYWNGRNWDLAHLDYLETKNMTAAINNLKAWQTYGGDESTGLGNFTVDKQGIPQGIGSVTKDYNGNYYGVYKGETHELKPNKEGYFDIGDVSKVDVNDMPKAYVPTGNSLKELSSKGYTSVLNFMTPYGKTNQYGGTDLVNATVKESELKTYYNSKEFKALSKSDQETIKNMFK